MTTEEILQIGKVERDDENIAIIERFKEQISAWLKSDKFQQITVGGGQQHLCVFALSATTRSSKHKLRNQRY
ncbi:hypothetical protein [Campylobacter sp.]|uniref:hypothetical protein n=1 Tax=Campylobacter sp. TaxID=205 RepID=UPI002AA68CDE|nr:hypothetical protein [Campylobacter sp.]MCI6661751.1 hypothetical protein [Campylobacter sp.]